jgi:serine/threonine-protein kinase
MSAADSSAGSVDAVRAAVAGQHTVDRLLGQGGMGAVYLGRDETLDRPVAIKVIKPDHASSDLIRDRFLQEARSVARLRHPNIVSVYSAGESNGLLWFAMELVEGQSLRELVEKDSRLPHAQVERILSEIALALDHAHTQGLVHRDVKPDNILIETATGRALLTDFGVARATQAGAEQGLTQTGMIIGSPRYMAPEQISGDRGIDGRADLYALALVGYELYAGHPVVEAGTVASMIYKHMSETPPPLATAVAGIPPYASAAIARGLEKDPDKRWQTGADFAKALRGGEVAGVAHMHRELRRRTLMIAAAAVVVVAAIGAWIGLRPAGARGNSFLVTPFEVQSGDQGVQWLRDGSVNMLTLTLGQWSDLNVVDYERTLSLIDAENLGSKPRLSAEDAFSLARRAGASRVVMGQVLTTNDSLIVIAKLYDVASKKSNQQAQASVARGSDPRPLFDRLGQQLLDIQGFNGSMVQLSSATTTNLGAYRAYLDGVKLLNSWRLPEADREFVKAITLDSTFALAYHKRALGLGWSNTNAVEYVTTSTKAFELSSRLPPRERSLVVGHHHLALALQQSNLGDSVGSAREFDESIKAYRELIEPPRGDSLVAEAWYGLADAYFHRRVLNATLPIVAADLTQSMRRFRKTLAIDSTYHLAYSHLVQLYNNAATGNGPLFIGDSAFFADSATLRRLGQPRIEALRDDARRHGIEVARAWTRADDQSTQAFFQLAQSFSAANRLDSGIATLREALAKPRSGGPLARLALLQYEEMAGDTGANATLTYILDRLSGDSLRTIALGTRFTFEGQMMTSAAMQGRADAVDQVAKLYRTSDPTLPLSKVSSAGMIEYFRIAHRLALGDSMTPAYRRSLLSASWLDSVPGQVRGVKQGITPVPYLAFLITHDTAFKRQLTSWASQQQSGSFTELDAQLALDRGDTAAAMTIARSFTPPDSLKDANFSFGGMRTLARAEVLERLGMTRRAAETYAVVDPARVTRNGLVEPGMAIWVRSLVAQARLWAKLGERDKAIAAYEEFLRRWRDADGSAAKQVSTARSELARLKDSPAGR